MFVTNPLMVQYLKRIRRTMSTLVPPMERKQMLLAKVSCKVHECLRYERAY